MPDRFGWLRYTVRPLVLAAMAGVVALAFARVALRKLATSPAERMLARTMRADFGGVPEDVADAVPGRAALPASDTVSAAPRAAAADTRPAAPPAPQTAMPRFLERLAHAR